MTQTTSGRAATVPCPFCLTLNRVRLERVADRPKCGECGKPMLLDRPIKVADDNLERVVGNTDVPVLVDFYADWCAPCKMMAPTLDELAGERTGEILLAKLDTDRSPSLSVEYSIRSIPTLILFHSGREIGRQTGVVNRAQLDEWIEGALRDAGA